MKEGAFVSRIAGPKIFLIISWSMPVKDHDPQYDDPRSDQLVLRHFFLKKQVR